VRHHRRDKEEFQGSSDPDSGSESEPAVPRNDRSG